MTTRVHISLVVNDLDKTKQFYETLFGQPVSKEKNDYHNFRLDEPPIHLAFHQAKQPKSTEASKQINHFGIELPDHAVLEQWRQRVAQSGIKLREQSNTRCCYAQGDKFWVTDPDQHLWEVWVKTGDLGQNHCGSNCSE